MLGHEFRSEVYEIVIIVILLLEYLWGRPDVALKHDQTQQKRIRQTKPERTMLDKEMD